MLRFLITIIIALALFSQATSARGGVMLSIGSISLNAGQTSAVDVWIENGSSDLQSYGIQFTLEFAAKGSLSFNTPTMSYLVDRDYVFFGDSRSEVSGPFDSVDMTHFSSDTYNGADFTSSKSNVSLVRRRLLTTLNVTASASADPGAYKIGLNSLVSAFFNADAESIDVIIPVDGVFGTVTVNGVQNISTVPEPTSALVIGVAGCLLIFGCRRKKRPQKATFEAF